MTSEAGLREFVEQKFAAAGIVPISVQVRSFPGETIAIVEVASGNYESALHVAEGLSDEIESGFVTVRQRKVDRKSKGPVQNVHDARVPALIELMNARSRTSENQPSLRYIKDVEERLNLAMSPRHHLIFGRRGVGKTSMLLEARRSLEASGQLVLWVNMHSLRGLDPADAFLTISTRLCDLAIGALGASTTAVVKNRLVSVRNAVDEQLYAPIAAKNPSSIIPKLQQAIARFCIESGRSIYLFIDDVHYLPAQIVPHFLDLLQGVTRDNPIWLKVAGIQHQTRWFIPSPPTGLQTGHDAAIISLDITLENPEQAKSFLQNVLKTYLEESDTMPIAKIFSREAVERLVLASGGVPRDFLTLGAASLQRARQRGNAKTVGVQDVNNAAGIAAQTKLQELEDDAAAAQGRSQVLVLALNLVREFLLTREQITFFRVDFLDKEAHPGEYRLLQALADLRMLHLINGSLSDPHQAGHRSEVYLLDLSQYSGSRLKQKLTVLDFENGHIVMKRTRSTEKARVGDTVLRLVSLLRRGPLFELGQLEALIAQAGAVI